LEDNTQGKRTELVTYIRNNHIRPIVEEKEEIIEKTTGSGKKKHLKRMWVRLGKGQLRGVLVSNGANSVGWSLCDRKDTFSKEEALRIARNRETEGDAREIPFSLRKHVDAMLDRSRRFFK
jgi:uncharacterized protein (DUF2344 family)